MGNVNSIKNKFKTRNKIFINKLKISKILKKKILHLYIIPQDFPNGGLLLITNCSIEYYSPINGTLAHENINNFDTNNNNIKNSNTLGFFSNNVIKVNNQISFNNNKIILYDFCNKFDNLLTICLNDNSVYLYSIINCNIILIDCFNFNKYLNIDIKSKSYCLSSVCFIQNNFIYYGVNTGEIIKYSIKNKEFTNIYINIKHRNQSIFNRKSIKSNNNDVSEYNSINNNIYDENKIEFNKIPNMFSVESSYKEYSQDAYLNKINSNELKKLNIVYTNSNRNTTYTPLKSSKTVDIHKYLTKGCIYIFMSYRFKVLLLIEFSNTNNFFNSYNSNSNIENDKYNNYINLYDLRKQDFMYKCKLLPNYDIKKNYNSKNSIILNAIYYQDEELVVIIRCYDIKYSIVENLNTLEYVNNLDFMINNSNVKSCPQYLEIFNIFNYNDYINNNNYKNEDKYNIHPVYYININNIFHFMMYKNTINNTDNIYNQFNSNNYNNTTYENTATYLNIANIFNKNLYSIAETINSNFSNKEYSKYSSKTFNYTNNNSDKNKVVEYSDFKSIILLSNSKGFIYIIDFDQLLYYICKNESKLDLIMSDQEFSNIILLYFNICQLCSIPDNIDRFSLFLNYNTYFDILIITDTKSNFYIIESIIDLINEYNYSKLGLKSKTSSIPYISLDFNFNKTIDKTEYNNIFITDNNSIVDDVILNNSIIIDNNKENDLLNELPVFSINHDLLMDRNLILYNKGKELKIIFEDNEV